MAPVASFFGLTALMGAELKDSVIIQETDTIWINDEIPVNVYLPPELGSSLIRKTYGTARVYNTYVLDKAGKRHLAKVDIQYVKDTGSTFTEETTFKVRG